jgi:uridylate kinase
MSKEVGKKDEYIVLSLGGSLVAPKTGIDWRFLKGFRELIISQVEKGKRFIIIVGGGSTCRKYQEAAGKVTELTKDDQDWLGIHTTRLNAHLIKTIFRKYAHPRINKNPRTKEDLNVHFAHGEGVMVAAGWRPGWSTDYVATILAERLGATTLINLSNIEYVYDKDPNKFDDAVKIEEINWADFRKIVGDEWDPGLNMPFDPIASKLAQKIDLKVVITDGGNLDNLENIFTGKKFTGTTIRNS